jgi:hypothetical protein
MVADTDITDALRVAALDGNGQGLDALGGGYQAAVAIGLLLKVLPLLYDNRSGPIQFLIPLYRTEIGCT